MMDVIGEYTIRSLDELNIFIEEKRESGDLYYVGSFEFYNGKLYTIEEVEGIAVPELSDGDVAIYQIHDFGEEN